MKNMKQHTWVKSFQFNVKNEYKKSKKTNNHKIEEQTPF